jgi:hypothetical protein
MIDLTNTLAEFNKLNEALVTALGKAGSLADSHEVVVNQETTFTNINIMANDYWFWQNKGRDITKEGNYPALVRPKIDEWVKKLPDWYAKDKKDGSKGKKLTKAEQAFLVTRKIHKEGYKGNFYVDKTIPNFEAAINKAVFEDIQNYFNNEFNKAAL